MKKSLLYRLYILIVFAALIVGFSPIHGAETSHCSDELLSLIKLNMPEGITYEDLNKFPPVTIQIRLNSILKILDNLILVEKINPNIIFLQAVQKGLLLVAEYLFQHSKIEINYKAEGGITPLMVAAMSGNADMLKYLLSKEGLNINLKSDEGQTAEDLAKQFRKSNIVEIFEQIKKK